MMETLRLKLIQQPSHVDRLLSSLIRVMQLVPQDAYMVRERSELTDVLRDRILKAERNGCSWECWSDGKQACLFIAEMSLPLSRERGSPVLLISQYSQDGELKESSHWVTDEQERWRRSGD
ncbi:MAG: hypothetical protein ACREU2_00965 [Steroidobacteraceae bacterium]